MKRYKIELPNDYSSEADDAALQAAYPNLKGEELGATALQDILSNFQPYEVEQVTDYGLIIRTRVSLPPNLPRWAWISEDKYPDDSAATDWVQVNPLMSR